MVTLKASMSRQIQILDDREDLLSSSLLRLNLSTRYLILYFIANKKIIHISTTINF